MLVKTPQLLAPRANERPSSTSGWTDAEVISWEWGGDFQSTRGNLQQRLIHCFICSNLVSRSRCAFFTAFIPVPIVTCLHGNSCVILAEAMIWSSRRSSWTLPRGPDLRGSSANPHQGAEALQIICVNFYGKCLCKVMHIDLHLCFMQGWRYTCARWSSAVGALAPDTVERFFFFNALVQCLILNLSICTVFNPELLHRCVCVRCCSDFLLFLSLMCHHFLWWSCWAGSVVGFHPRVETFRGSRPSCTEAMEQSASS